MENLNFLQSIIRGKELTHFSYVLQVDVSEYLEGDHHFIEKTCFCHVSLQQAKYLICDSGLSIEAVVVSPSRRLSAIAELRNEARKRSIPFILFSLKFEQSVKDLAIELKTEDYQCGVLNLPLGYINFMKRLKRFNEGFRKAGKRKQVKINVGKRSVDVLVSCSLLLLLSPIFVLIAAFIKLGSRGPILDVFQKAGHSYKIFDVYEFRTDVEHEYYSWAPWFGSLLRKSGLYKLPELINVLKGDISLVGEKPLNLNEAAKLTTDKIAIRLLSTPGLTGLWSASK
ncbi:MAG TPA: sugar transferase [Cyclobacteriaceae bacterium]|jgi:hypothetical protein|nr:sugar transferase [Cyclobacteriaceae bacterium]